MYLSKVEIKNIRAIKRVKFDFTGKEPGWHVLIGDNGAGKSSIIRSISAALVGHFEILGLRENWQHWLRHGAESAEIRITRTIDDKVDYWPPNQSRPTDQRHELTLRLEKRKSVELLKASAELDEKFYSWWQGTSGWFSAAYGPFRRFTGGSDEWQSIWGSYPRLAAHLSAFGENVALSEVTKWLTELNYKILENKSEGFILKDIIEFVNHGQLLPKGAELDSIDSDGVFFKDANQTRVSVTELSDGFRSILSLTFDLIRQLVQNYGGDLVFKSIRNGEMQIDLPGVVLIDEIDAHLHPTWQSRIGNWFLTYFPKMQFIVTTHSPIICRAAEKGSIWRLRSPGSEEPTKELQGIERDRLIYGNVLEALGTEAFGASIERSSSSQEKLERMAELNVKSIRGDLNDQEKNELTTLKAILPTGR